MDNIAAPRAPLLSTLASTLVLTRQRLFAGALLLMIAPLWFGEYLPMVDIPQHAAQITALKEIWDGNTLFADVFEINWFTPYILGYLLLYVVSLVVPVAIAAKIIVSVSLVAIPILTGSLLRTVGGDERWKWLAIPSAFGFSFYWGFLSFLVAVPIALLFLIHTVRFAERPTLRNAVGVACLSIFLFFCHVIALGFASLVAVTYIAARSYRDLRTMALRLIPYAASVPVIVLWVLFTRENEASVHTDPVIYGFIVERLIELFTQPAGGDFMKMPLVDLLVLAALLLVPGLAGGRLSRRPERWIPFVVGVLTFMLMPRFAFSTAYVFHRVGIFLVPLWLMAWDPPALESNRRLDWAVMLVIVIWGLTNVGFFAGFAAETRSFERIMAHMEPGRRVGALYVHPWSPSFRRPVYLNFGAWYQAQRAGIVDYNFANSLAQMVRYKDRDRFAPRINEFLAWNPTHFRWERHGGDSYDYFLIKSSLDPAEAIFKEKQHAVELVSQIGWWWLYRNNELRPPGSPPRQLTETERQRWAEEEGLPR